MMDARPFFPRGWRFEAEGFAPDGVTLVKLPSPRVDHPVRYYFIDYGPFHQSLPGRLGWPRYGCTRAEDISAIRSIKNRRFHCWERFLERPLSGIFVIKCVFGTFKLTIIVKKYPWVRISCGSGGVHDD